MHYLFIYSKLKLTIPDFGSTSTIKAENANDVVARVG